MFCGKCGKEINNEAVVCPHCGCAVAGKAVVRKRGGETSTLSMLAVVFAFLAPIVGLILGIVGMSSYNDESLRKKCKGAIFISLGMFLAYFMLGFFIGTMMV